MNNLIARIACSLGIVCAAVPQRAFAAHEDETSRGGAIVLSDWERLSVIVHVDARGSTGVVEWAGAQGVRYLVRLPQVKEERSAEEAAISLFLELSALGWEDGPYASVEVLSRGTVMRRYLPWLLFIHWPRSYFEFLFPKEPDPKPEPPIVKQDPIPEVDPCASTCDLVTKEIELEDAWNGHGNIALTKIKTEGTGGKYARTFLLEVIAILTECFPYFDVEDNDTVHEILDKCFPNFYGQPRVKELFDILFPKTD